MVSKLRLKKRNAIGESFLANPGMVPRSAVGVFDLHENILKKHRIWVYNIYIHGLWYCRYNYSQWGNYLADIIP